jgi:hypothetical protein
MKHIKTFESFLFESINQSLLRANLTWTIDGSCGLFASTFAKLFPNASVYGILDKSYKPKPTMQHYFVELNGEYFDGGGTKSLATFEKTYGGTAVKVNQDGLEAGKSEDSYSDLPEWGEDPLIAKALKSIKI